MAKAKKEEKTEAVAVAEVRELKQPEPKAEPKTEKYDAVDEVKVLDGQTYVLKDRKVFKKVGDELKEVTSLVRAQHIAHK